MKAIHATVAVTGLNATDNPGPGVATIRALRADPTFRGRIIGLAYDALDPGLYADGLLDAAFLIPYPSAGREALLDRLAYIQDVAGLDVLLPTLDSELPALLDQEPTLQAMGISTFLPTREQYDRRTKARLTELIADGVPVPHSQTLLSADQLYTLTDFTYPLVIKGVFYGAKICHTLDDAVRAFHKHAATWGLPIIVQQFIPGEDLNVCAVGDGEGGLIGAVAMKKLMVTDTGKGWAGVTIVDDALMDIARKVIAALSWRGPCEIEVRRAPDGSVHLLEVNPRLPAWCDLTAAAGQNHPLTTVRLALGQAVEPSTAYAAGKAFVRISLNQLIDIADTDAISTLGHILPPPALEVLP